MPVRGHPHDQTRGRREAGGQNQQDGEQQTIALIAGQMRKQQLAGAFYNIVGHSFKSVDSPAVTTWPERFFGLSAEQALCQKTRKQRGPDKLW